MTGDGIAIRHARQTATAKAEAALTATAEAQAARTATADAEAALTATAEAALTATAAAAMTATAEAQSALATQQAIAALTATAAAQPTATPTPQPTATPAPFAVTGTVDQVEGDRIVLKPADGTDQSASYAVRPDAQIARDGESVPLAKIVRGDTVTLTVDGTTRLVTGLTAESVPASGLARFWWVPVLPAALGLCVVWLGRLRAEEPFIVKRVPA
jgi:hypothetical protein